MRKGPHPIDLHVGNRLKALRNLRQMSQQELAREVGLTFQQIQKYERGANRIAASRLYEFAATLGVSIGSFYEGLNDFYRHSDFPPFLSKQEISWLESINQIRSPGVRDQLRRLTNALAQEH